MGSVKSLRMLRQPTETKMGEGVFEFGDAFSVFDYGSFPDTIEGKGEALCVMASYNFRELEKRGMKTHFISNPKMNEMQVHLVRKLLPEENDLSRETNFLVPLEIIFRDVLGAGSSVFKRMERGELSYQDLGLEAMPEPGTKLNPPIIDYSTKFERLDRYFRTQGDARAYSTLSEQQISSLRKQALEINRFLREKAGSLGWEHLDGKVEAGMDTNGEVMWVDALGTLDEDRFEVDGFKLSKQLIRNYYKGTPWYGELEKAKEKKTEFPVPPELPLGIRELVSDMYKAAANEWTGEKAFDVRPLSEVIKKGKELQ